MYPDHELSILVIDGDVEVRTLLYSLLDAQGCLVATRRPDAEALRYLADHKPEAAVLGQMGPGKERTRFVRQIQRVSPNTRVLLLREPGQTCEPLDPGVVEANAWIERPSTWTSDSPAVERLLGVVFHAV